MSDIEPIAVEVAYALPHKQKIVELLVEPGTTAMQAAKQSKMEKFFPDIDLDLNPMGLFGQAFGARGLAKASEYQLQAGDRVEIYRPLTADPKEIRRRRAEKTAAVKEKGAE